MIKREMKQNGKCGSKLVTFPKSVIEIAGFADCKIVNLEVENGKITITKGE